MTPWGTNFLVDFILLILLADQIQVRIWAWDNSQQNQQLLFENLCLGQLCLVYIFYYWSAKLTAIWIWVGRQDFHNRKWKHANSNFRIFYMIWYVWFGWHFHVILKMTVLINDKGSLFTHQTCPTKFVQFA